MYRIRIRSRHARLSGGWMLSAAVVAVLSASAAYAAPTVLNFEDIAAGTTITAQYAARGVIFQQAYLDTDPAAHSGTRVLRTVAPTAEVFTAIPLVMTFTSAQARVKLFAGSPLVALNGTLTAFDANGAVVAHDGPKLVAHDVFTTVFEVTVTTPSITRAELQLEGSAHQAIDDLEFDGQPAAQVPTTPPVVTITSPVNGSDLDVNTIAITGTITGDGLLSSSVNMTVQWLRPPEQSTAPPFTSALVVTGTGTTRQFSLPGGFTGVPLGPITVTVSAQNTGALTGTATSTFTNLPGGIRSRFTAQGGTAAMGAFRFGLSSNGCKIAVYEKGAISDAKLLISGDIFTKWLSLKGPSNNTGFFGCPLVDEGSGPGNTRAQHFTGGRIYSNLPGTAYVPAVFADAIDQRGGELATGVPIADPVSPVEPVTHSTNTWLYQQFTRPDRPDLLPSTLEIRGTPPTLWMEREGGDLSLPVEPLGAIWENFPCGGNLGPCTVDAPQPDPPPIQNAGDMFCGGVSISDEGKVGVIVNGPRREWQPILLNDYISTPIFGVVKKSFLAGEDFFASHEWFYNCPFESVRFDCPSDWNVDVIPIGPQARVAPYSSIFAAGNPTVVELEYERFYGEFVVWMGYPAPGELLYTTGRWIIDCGHSDFASELHPVFMYAKMKTVTSITDPFTGLVSTTFGGQPATQADIWVNGWYPGGDDPDHAIEFDIYPPPRPTPTATLVVNKPVDADAVAGVTIEWKLDPPEAVNHVHVKFTAPYRENHVTVWGEMKWEINRGYQGQWYLYWSP